MRVVKALVNATSAVTGETMSLPGFTSGRTVWSAKNLVQFSTGAGGVATATIQFQGAVASPEVALSWIVDSTHTYNGAQGARQSNGNVFPYFRAVVSAYTSGTFNAWFIFYDG